MDRLTECLIELEKAGLDVFDVGCRWQEKALLSVNHWQDFLIFIGSGLAVYLLNEAVNDYFKSSR